ncbi:hypothetical protein GS904_17125 [Rhodococcus hoagii]|nr:hypothetical protein [Prescottella equi]NKU94111.1 hypothetical protein [Prescottella equi]
MAERITIATPERLVLRLPAPQLLVAHMTAPADPVAVVPAPIDAVLTLPAPQPDRLVLPESSMPRVPGIASGGVTADVSITGVAVGRALAAGAITAEASVSATAKARAVAAGAITAAVSIAGTARPYATGAVTAAVAITGKAVAKLAGAVTAAVTVTGTAKAALAGSVTGTVPVTGTASARAVATGSVTAEASITGSAVVPAYPMGMDKVGTQVIPGASSGAWANAVKITDWAVRSGFPSSSIINNSLVASAAMTVTYSAKVTFQTGGVGSLVQFHLAKNETELVASANTGGTLTGTISLNPGDTLSLWGAGNSGIGNGYRTVVAGPTNTYLYWTVN